MSNKRPNAKYAEWITEDGLIRVEGMATDGLTNEQIAGFMGIAPKTLYDWQKRFPELRNALKKGKELTDRKVERSLLQRATGYEYIEKKSAPVPYSERELNTLMDAAIEKYTANNPKATDAEVRAHLVLLPRYYMEVVEEKTKHVPPDTTAQIFWLKNRKPEQWRDTQLTVLQREKLEAETAYTRAKTDLLQGAKADTSLLEALISIVDKGDK